MEKYRGLVSSISLLCCAGVVLVGATVMFRVTARDVVVDDFVGDPLGCAALSVLLSSENGRQIE